MTNDDHPIELVLEGVKLSAGNLDLLGLLANKLGEAPLNEDEVGAISDEMFSQLETKRATVLDRRIRGLQSWIREELMRRAWTHKKKGFVALQAAGGGAPARREGGVRHGGDVAAGAAR